MNKTYKSILKCGCQATSKPRHHFRVLNSGHNSIFTSPEKQSQSQF